MNAKWLEFFIICFFIQKHLESIRLDHTSKNEEQQNMWQMVKINILFLPCNKI